jgi:hypothetical protein
MFPGPPGITSGVWLQNSARLLKKPVWIKESDIMCTIRRLYPWPQPTQQSQKPGKCSPNTEACFGPPRRGQRRDGRNDARTRVVGNGSGPVLSSSLAARRRTNARQRKSNRRRTWTDERVRLVRGWLGERLARGAVARCGRAFCRLSQDDADGGRYAFIGDTGFEMIIPVAKCRRSANSRALPSSPSVRPSCN